MAQRDGTVPVWRTGEHGTKLYVEARLSDGVPRLFLVDTGASLSVLQQGVVEELGLTAVARRGEVVGLSGRVPWRSSVVPTLDLAGFALEDVEFAVGVPGIPRYAGFAPVAGVLGNNIWQQFVLSIDYPANLLTLQRPEQAQELEGLRPMAFNGMHARVEVELTAARDGDRATETVWLEVDTGAGGLLLAGPRPGPLAELATEGLEPIFGVGAGDNLPVQDFLQRTRRLDVEQIRIGDVVLQEDLSASWINYDEEASRVGPAALPGLLGHQLLDEHRVVLDYPGRRFGLLTPTGTPTVRDVHAWSLGRLKRGREAADHLARARPLAALNRLDDAVHALQRALALEPGHPEAAILLARIQRSRGETGHALEALAGLPASDLVAHGEVVAAVNALWLSGLADEGLRLALSATAARPGQPAAWVALSDAQRFAHDLVGARSSLQRASQLEENPDAHLLRRAWLASLEGDTHGAMTHLRRLMSLHPGGNLAPWMYAHLPLSTAETALLRDDLAEARSRLHPSDGPLDFFAGTLARAGASPEGTAVQRLYAAGVERDCTQAAPGSPQRDNCEAWYRGMARWDLSEARTRIDRATAAHPDRSDYLDTRAVVLEAQGDLEGALQAARAAAVLEPDNLYFLWQADRLAAAAATTGDPP